MTDHEEQPQTSTGTEQQLIDNVRELIAMMGKGGISELDLSSGDMSIRLRTAAASVQQVVMSAPQSTPQPVVMTAAPVAEPEAPIGHVVTSPMIGTFYSAPAPGEPAFANIGDEVDAGQVIGIIEAMKIMNEITADKSGIIVEMLVENAQPVEFGSPILRIAPAGSLE